MFGGGELLGGVEVAAGRPAFGQRIELEAGGVGGPVERVAAVGVS